MKAEDLLILRRPEIDQRFQALGERLVKDAALRELYVKDPARVIATSVFPDSPVPGAEINRGNRLLYSLLTNEGFQRWAQDYQETLAKTAVDATKMDDPEEALRTYLAVTDRAKLHQDIVEAIAEYADPELIASLTWRRGVDDDGIGTELALALSLEPQITPSVAVDIETFIYAVAAVAVFAVAFAAVFAATVVERDVPVSRLDVQTVARQLAERLKEHGQELRKSGALTDFKAGM